MAFSRKTTASAIYPYAVSPLLVAVTTWLLYAVQHAVPSTPDTYVRPFSVCFLIPVCLITAWGGRWPGYVTLFLSLFCLEHFLMAWSHNVFSMQHLPDLAEIFFLLVTGLFMVIGVNSMRDYGAMRTEAEESAARLRSIMDTTPIGILVTNLAGIVRYANPEAERMLGRSPLKMRLDAVEYGENGPSRKPGVAAPTILTAVMDSQAAVEQREWVHEQDGAPVIIEARATLVRDQSGAPRSGLVVLSDITERRKIERLALARSNREALVNRIGEAIRSTLDPDEIQAVAVNSLGEALKADRCYFMTYDYAADYAWAGRDYRSRDLPSLAGRYRTSELKLQPSVLYRPGKTLVVDDVTCGFFPEILVGDFARLKIRSILGVPLYEDGSLAASMVVAMADQPRTWTAEEILLAEAVAAQTRSAVAVARLLIQERSRRRNEEVSSRIAQTLRYSTDAQIIRARAFSVIGAALEADYCFAITRDDEISGFAIDDDWHAEGLPSVAGVRKAAELPLNTESILEGGPTLVVDDPNKDPWSGDTATAMAALGLTSMIAVPMFDKSRLHGLLVVGMANGHRLWTGDEVRLMENATAQTRATLDAAWIRQREHTVAEALQRALQPRPPEHIPVFELDFYYQAALDEASVGGDFYDVFAVGPGVYAIVIGDVSGKGIAAAAQIASVRNMLRYAVSHRDNLSDAVTRLNRTLAGDSQLTGFATLFVGIYNSMEDKITYVSCGHEPALIRRGGSDIIDELNSTGPPLGAFEESDFDQEWAPIFPGDTLLLYTDGISEAGPSRSALLGTAGIVAILREQPVGESAHVLVNRLVTRVKEYANGVMRDDVCIVAAVIGTPN